ncbi:Methyl-accepting chemotaxis protein III [compost metagenome]
MDHIDQSTQQNAALVEEASAAARSMEEQATQLRHTVAAFRVEAESSTARVDADRALQARQPSLRLV